MTPAQVEAEKNERQQNKIQLQGQGKALPLLLCNFELMAYQAMMLLASPLLLRRKWRLYRNAAMKNEFDWARWKIQFREADIPRLPPRPSTKQEKRNENVAKATRVVFITFGWGEVATIEPLVRELRHARPEAQLLFTVMHREAIPAAAQLSDGELLPLPFDCVFPVARWFNRARPDIVVFYEHFHMATMLRGLSLTTIPFFVLHARKQRAETRSRRKVLFKKWELRPVRNICFSSTKHLQGAQQLLPDGAQTHITGSIKFPHKHPRLDAERSRSLRQWIEGCTQSAPLFVAGSTHAGEEEFLLEAFEQLRRLRSSDTDTDAPVLLLAPRKPDRADKIAELILKRGWRLARRTHSQVSKSVTRSDVLLLDTLGELPSAYGFATGSFVGGTLKGSSHNVAEPLVWHIPVAYGPGRGNFEIEQRLCEESGVGFRVSSPESLASHWMELLESTLLREELRERAKTLVESQRDAFSRTLDVLIKAIDAANPAPEKTLSPSHP